MLTKTQQIWKHKLNDILIAILWFLTFILELPKDILWCNKRLASQKMKERRKIKLNPLWLLIYQSQRTAWTAINHFISSIIQFFILIYLISSTNSLIITGLHKSDDRKKRDENMCLTQQQMIISQVFCYYYAVLLYNEVCSSQIVANWT